MSAKIKKASAASLRRLETERWQKWAVQFEKMVRHQLRQAGKNPQGTTMLALVVGTFDTKGEYVQIFHGGGPPGRPAAFWRNFLIRGI